MTALDRHREVIRTACATLPGGAKDDDAPIFHAPWQTRIFALVVATVKQGHFPWIAFQERLARTIAAHPHTGDRRDDADVANHYFDCWLHAAEDTLIAEGFLADADIARQIEAIRDTVQQIRANQTAP